MRQVTILKIIASCMATLFIAACSPPQNANRRQSDLLWGEHQNGKWANMINLKPNESVAVCASNPEWVAAAHSAIEQWSTAIGRWGFFKVNPCGTSSTVTLNMAPFNQTGLNYFTNNPGRIYINSSATGDFMKAIVLHEMGHSFGLCDQYTDAGSANCSGTGSGRQENSEIMGATNEKKLKLTPGDIKGVQTIAKDLEIPATQAWTDFLKTSPIPPTSSSSVFVALNNSTGETTPMFEISVPKSETLILCPLTNQLSGASDCGSSQPIAMQFSRSVDNLDIYQTTQAVSSLSTTEQNLFLIVHNGKAHKFKISAFQN